MQTFPSFLTSEKLKPTKKHLSTRLSQEGWQPTQMHISTLLPQSLILAKLTFRPTPAVPRRKFQASELTISSAQAANQF